jgi:hypothetical protein
LPDHGAEPLLRYTEVGEDDVGQLNVGWDGLQQVVLQLDELLCRRRRVGAVPAAEEGLVEGSVELRKAAEAQAEGVGPSITEDVTVAGDL